MVGREQKKRVEEHVATKSMEELKRAAFTVSESTDLKKMTISPDEALALYIDMDLSVRQYNMMRSKVNSIHKDCFPSYFALKNTKKKFIPDEIFATETSVEVQLQSAKFEDTGKNRYKVMFICYIRFRGRWAWQGTSLGNVIRRNRANRYKFKCI